jgi:enoyl-CoA hydratase
MTGRFSTISLETIGAVARLTLNRPERANALNAVMLGEIGTALDEIERDTGLRVLIVRGAGAAFSSGFDLKEQMERQPKGVEQWRTILRHDFDTIMRFWHFPLPTIATVRGPCLAGACELALACDITIAADDAFFGEPELKFGAGIVAMLLPWIAGPKIAKEIILLGEDRVPAARAREIGMVNRVVSVSELDAAGLAMANHIAAIDPNLVKQTKRAINRAFEAQNMLTALEDALAIDLAIEGAGSPDKIEFMEIARRDGLKAALAWRDARFPGRSA